MRPPLPSRPAIDALHYEQMRQLLRQRAGIVLEPGKEYFVELRLGALAVEEGFDSLPALLDSLHTEESWGPLHRLAVESLAVTETSWFRDLHPFEALRKEVLPELIARRSDTRELRIWSAACASGQEAYSVAMLLREHFPLLNAWKVELTGTDFSTGMLRRARDARYGQIEVNRGLPAQYLVRYFRKDELMWRLTDDVRAMVRFFELNLVQPWPALPPQDVVLLRNVLIYFDPDTRRAVLQQLQRVLKPDGYLILGGGETSLTLDDTYEAVPLGRAVAYRARAARAA